MLDIVRDEYLPFGENAPAGARVRRHRRKSGIDGLQVVRLMSAPGGRYQASAVRIGHADPCHFELTVPNGDTTGFIEQLGFARGAQYRGADLSKDLPDSAESRYLVLMGLSLS